MTNLVFIGFPFDEIDAAYKKLESILEKNKQVKKNICSGGVSLPW